MKGIYIDDSSTPWTGKVDYFFHFFIVTSLASEEPVGFICFDYELLNPLSQACSLKDIPEKFHIMNSNF